VIGDSLWPVICVVEKLSGKAAIQRSRDLMTGLRSAGRALAIRHLALAAFAIAEVVKSIGFLWQSGRTDQANVVITATWFPVFALFAGAPLFLYDRTAANESGPLLQLDRTPEVRITARAFSVSSMIWLAAGAMYLMYQPIKLWLFGARFGRYGGLEAQEQLGCFERSSPSRYCGAHTRTLLTDSPRSSRRCPPERGIVPGIVGIIGRYPNSGV
jgi:hypothetical protein